MIDPEMTQSVQQQLGFLGDLNLESWIERNCALGFLFSYKSTLGSFRLVGAMALPFLPSFGPNL